MKRENDGDAAAVFISSFFLLLFSHKRRAARKLFFSFFSFFLFFYFTPNPPQTRPKNILRHASTRLRRIEKDQKRIRS